MPFDIPLQPAATLASGTVAWVALVYLVMAFGVRRGELVWTGRHPRRLPGPLRRRSLFYALLLLVTAVVISILSGAINTGLIPDRWTVPAGFVVTVFLGIAGLVSVSRGSKWERVLFAPIILLTAALIGYMTFG